MHCSLEKLLTSRRSSPAPSSSPHSGHPPRRSEAGPGSRFARWRRRHPACGSPEESNPPFPGSPSLRCSGQSIFLVRAGRDLLLIVAPRHPRFQRAFWTARTHRLTFRLAPSLSAPPRCVRSPQQPGLSPQPSVCTPLHQAPQEGEDEDDLLYFLRRDPCSSPRTPLGGDTGVVSLCCPSKLCRI